MADHFVQSSFAFTCSNAEMALLEEAFTAASDLLDGTEPAPPTPEFAALFPPTSSEDAWSGFRRIFCDAGFTDTGAFVEGGNSLDTPSRSTVFLWGDTSFQPEPVAEIIHRCCAETLNSGPIGFEWSVSCSKPRRDEFGGGWCAIFADRIEFETTRQMLESALAEAA